MKKSLSKNQSIFAAENHGLIYEFLNSRHLSEDEFYDIAALAYLESIPENECSDFRQIAFEAMDKAVNAAVNTGATEISIYELADAYRTYEEVLADENDQIGELLNEIAVKEQISCLEPTEKQMVSLILQGFCLKDITVYLHKNLCELNFMLDGIIKKLSVADCLAA